ncbi:CAT RNA binding domain-containing protein [Ligilactobacillus sp. MP3]|nr:CAT RNA binding domain-containing protein [Ligilactobacillus sp. MP3]MCQ4116570.1 CAT RNA binding domain-containing protein [Ligilactobacillus sp. MP3]
MKIFKVIINNIVITLDQNNQEIILMGRGLGFK